MWQVRSATRPQGYRSWLAALLLVPSVVFTVSACSSEPASAPMPQTIADKGTPYDDLLVPKLSASVTDGAVGVAVDQPVTPSLRETACWARSR